MVLFGTCFRAHGMWCTYIHIQASIFCYINIPNPQTTYLNQPVLERHLRVQIRKRPRGVVGGLRLQARPVDGLPIQTGGGPRLEPPQGEGEAGLEGVGEAYRGRLHLLRVAQVATSGVGALAEVAFPLEEGAGGDDDLFVMAVVCWLCAGVV